MRYLLATLEYPPQIGGVANYYSNLVSAWPSQDRWTVIDNSKDELVAGGRFGWLKAITTFRRDRFDLAFIGQILPLGTAALMARIFRRFDYAVFLHGMDLSFALRSPRKRWLTKLILKRAKYIICANSYVRQLLVERMPGIQRKVILINPGADAGEADNSVSDEIRKRYGLQGKKIIFSLGRLVKRKGFDRVIESLALIPEQDIIYLLAGDGPEREALKAQAAASPLADRIIFMGKISEKEKWSTLGLCDIFITASRDIDGDFEGFGIVYLEANLMGKPVIAGRAGGVGDAVIDGETGLLVNPEDPSAIAQAISRLLNDEQERERLGRAGRERAIADFSWKQQAENLARELAQ